MSPPAPPLGAAPGSSTWTDGARAPSIPRRRKGAGATPYDPIADALRWNDQDRCWHDQEFAIGEEFRKIAESESVPLVTLNLQR
jgi:hypothetical protein